MFDNRHYQNRWWLWVVTSPNEKGGLGLGEQFEQGTRALLIKQDQCIEPPLAHIF